MESSRTAVGSIAGFAMQEPAELNCKYWKTDFYSEREYVQMASVNSIGPDSGVIFGVKLDGKPYRDALYDLFGSQFLGPYFPFSRIGINQWFESYVRENFIIEGKQRVLEAVIEMRNTIGSDTFRFNYDLIPFMESFLYQIAYRMLTDYDFRQKSVSVSEKSFQINPITDDEIEAILTLYDDIYLCSFKIAEILSNYRYEEFPQKVKDLLIDLYGYPIVEPTLIFDFVTDMTRYRNYCDTSEYNFSKSVLSFGGDYTCGDTVYMRPYIMGKGFRQPAVMTVEPIIGADGNVILPNVIYGVTGPTYTQLAIANMRRRSQEKTRKFWRRSQNFRDLSPTLPSISNTVLHLYPAREYKPHTMQYFSR